MQMQMTGEASTSDSQVFSSSASTDTNSYMAVHAGRSHDRFHSISNAEASSIPHTNSTSIPITASSSSEPSQPAIHDCEAKGMRVLHSLHACAMIHVDHPDAPPVAQNLDASNTKLLPPLDRVLFFTRTAIAAVKELVDCTCAQHAHIALLCMTIFSKALYWYRLAVSPQYELSLCQASVGPESPILSSSNNGAYPLDSVLTDRVVTSVPIQIGMFHLEDEDQKLLMRGILLREVRKLEEIVDKMQAMGRGYALDDGDEEGQVLKWYRVAGSKMRKEVQDTLKLIKQSGNRSARPDG